MFAIMKVKLHDTLLNSVREHMYLRLFNNPLTRLWETGPRGVSISP